MGAWRSAQRDIGTALSIAAAELAVGLADGALAALILCLCLSGLLEPSGPSSCGGARFRPRCSPSAASAADLSPKLKTTGRALPVVLEVYHKGRSRLLLRLSCRQTICSAT